METQAIFPGNLTGPPCMGLAWYHAPDRDTTVSRVRDSNGTVLWVRGRDDLSSPPYTDLFERVETDGVVRYIPRKFTKA